MVSDCNFFAHKGCKIAAQNKYAFLANLALLPGFFWYGATICIGREMLCLPYAGFNFFCCFVFGNIFALSGALQTTFLLFYNLLHLNINMFCQSYLLVHLQPGQDLVPEAGTLSWAGTGGEMGPW